MKNTKMMNSWDLVDLSVYKVLGRHLCHLDRAPLLELSKSELWWERRMAMVATYEWIRSGDFDFTLRLSRKYLGDENRYVLMATGWMLREVGKQNPQALRDFLIAAESIPVIVARYATEKMPELQQQIARRK
jgi:3-methyladenine DNA glycosylase AlkD